MGPSWAWVAVHHKLATGQWANETTAPGLLHGKGVTMVLPAWVKEVTPTLHDCGSGPKGVPILSDLLSYKRSFLGAPLGRFGGYHPDQG